MKHIFLNLKRFDVPVEMGGVNRIAAPSDWGRYVVANTISALRKYDPAQVEFVQFFPEAHILSAMEARGDAPIPHIGCLAVYRTDVAVGGNFGAFTSNRPAAAAKALGCSHVIIGHCEERNDLNGVLAEAGVVDAAAVNRILNQEIRQAAARGMKILYCIGENSEELDSWKEVLGEQLRTGLEGVDSSGVVIGYEPVWSIGPGKTPAGRDYIEKIARFVKEQTGGLDVVYGGGLKTENASMLASIPEIDGGLIALTRFSGEIGFYPDEYAEIIRTYLGE